MRAARLFALLLVLSPPAAALAADKPVVVVGSPGSDTTVIKDGAGIKDGASTSVLKRVPAGVVGIMGKDKVILHSDGRGTTVGKVGKDKVLCHSDPKSGVTLCK